MKYLSTQLALELLATMVGALFASIACFLGVYGVNPVIIGIVFWLGLFVMYSLFAGASRKIHLEGLHYAYMAAFVAVVVAFFVGVFNIIVLVITTFSPELAWVINYALQLFTGLFALAALGILGYVLIWAVAGRITRTGLPRGF